MTRFSDLYSAKKIFTFLREISDSKTKKVLVISLLGQISSTFLDLFGIFIFGLLGALIISGLNFRPPQGSLKLALEFLNLDNNPLEVQALVLGLAAVLLLLLRSLISILLYKFTSKILNMTTAAYTQNIITNLMETDLSVLEHYRKQEWLSGLVKGIQSTIVRIPISCMTMLTELALLAAISMLMLLFQPLLALCLFVGYGLCALAISRYSRSSLSEYSNSDLKFEISASGKLLEILEGFSDLTVNGKPAPFVQGFVSDRASQLLSQAHLLIYPISVKYVFEGIIVFGSFLISGLTFLFFDSVKAVTIISVFLIASSRIGPSVLRLQQAVNMFRTSLPQVHLFLSQKDLLVSRDLVSVQIKEELVPDPKIMIEKASFKYSGIEVLDFINLEIKSGERVVLVGPSGGGKSTLIKLIAGLLLPSNGVVKVGDLTAFENRILKRHRIGYVPQTVTLFHGTVRENLLLGLSGVDDVMLEEMLIKVGLVDLQSDGNVLDRKIDDFSAQLSGGQKQRLGLARALIGNPQILILDEFTNALDGTNELLVIHLLETLGEGLTVMAISHRLSTVECFPRIIYIDGGKILYDGVLKEMKKELFDTI